MFNVTNHQRNANWNHNETSSHTCQNVSSINQQTTSAGEDVEKVKLFCTLVGMQMGTATMESSMELHQTIKNGSAFWFSDPTSGNISEGTQNTNSKEHKHLYVHCSIINKHQDMKATQVSINRWVVKELWDIYKIEYSGVKKIRKFYPLQQYGWTWRALC